MPFLLAAALFAVPAPSASVPPDADAPKTIYELPDDPKSVVLSMDYKGGFTPPRKKDDPALSILADGTVLMPDRYGTGKDVTGEISRDELQELLRFVLEEHDFTEIDPAKIKQAVQEAQRKRNAVAPRVADAPTTHVTVSLPDVQHAASYYAVGLAAGQNPGVERLQDFAAIQDRLRRLMNVVRGGGREKVAEMLRLANAELKKQHPKAAPLTMDHFTSASERSDGSTHYTFRWSVTGTPGVPESRSHVNATVVVPARGEPEVTIRATP